MEDKTVATKVAEEKEELLAKEKEKTDAVRKVLEGLFDSPRGALDASGTPLVRKVSAMVGHPVKKPLMLSLWNELKELKG